jgi:hypothetical protein
MPFFKIGANRSLMMGCVLAVQNITDHCPWAIPIVFDHFGRLGVLREGDLCGLRTMLETMSPPIDQAPLVPVPVRFTAFFLKLCANFRVDLDSDFFWL